MMAIELFLFTDSFHKGEVLATMKLAKNWIETNNSDNTYNITSWANLPSRRSWKKNCPNILYITSSSENKHLGFVFLLSTSKLFVGFRVTFSRKIMFTKSGKFLNIMYVRNKLSSPIQTEEKFITVYCGL